MTVEKKTIRSDIPGHHASGSVGFVGSPSAETRRLIVGRDISLTGEISACEHLIIEGTVQADRLSARRLDIPEPGLFAGKAAVQDAVIAGRFEGRLSVSGRLTVKSTGRVYGEVEYGTLEVEGGGRLEGQVGTIQAEAEMPHHSEGEETPDNVESLFGGVQKDEARVTEERPAVYRRASGY
jgi:cytoskeletal protein CcmA (bactofilin family)